VQIILTEDFNSIPNSAIYYYLTHGYYTCTSW